MSLPSSRDITINPTDPIPSALLNKLQDCVVGRKKPPYTRAAITTQLGLWGSTPWPLGTGGFTTSTGIADGDVYLPVEEGDRITGITVSSFGTGALTVTHSLYKISAAMANTLLQTFTDVNRAAAWGDFVFPAFAPYVVGAGEVLRLEISVVSAGAKIGNIRYTCDKL